MPLTEAQQVLRRAHLGASETPVILLGDKYPFKTRPTDIYWRKVSATQPQEEQDESKTKGHCLEGALLTWAAEMLGVSIVRNQFRVLQEGPGANILSATHDALIVGKHEGLEAKYVGRGNPSHDLWGDEGTDAVPPEVTLQTQQQMRVSGLDGVWVPVAYEAYTLEFRLYRVLRDDEIMDLATPDAVAWWQNHILAKLPPNGDGTPPLEYLKAICREPATTCNLPASAIELWNQYETLGASEKDAKGKREAAKAQIIHLLGDCEGGFLPDGRIITFKEQKATPSVDHTTFRARAPEIYSEVVTQGTCRVLRIGKAQKKGA